MNRPTHSFIVIALLVCAALLISACTREATTDALPTNPPDGVGGGGEPAQQATNAAAMEQLFAQGQTQTAQAPLGLNTALPGAITPTPLVAQQTPVPAATAIPAATAVPAAGTPVSYTVQSGDWLYSIARKFNITPQALIAANPQINANTVLKPGTVLNIPSGSSPVPGAATTGEKTYVVKPGENLFRIALNSGTNYQTLAQLNNIPAPYTVFPGQVLKMP
ncbi:MAG: LysM peptidoglycan-binding domain-containing protein [Chloroflexi bacterium]|nr:LysM peptidoglycan-binding domain-containing protein [Chloroflexota bacterium]